MTESQIQNALVAHFNAAVTNVRATTSLEDAMQNYVAEQRWILVMPRKYDPNKFQDEDNWEFLVQASASLQPGAQETTIEASQADVDLTDELKASVNEDAGFEVLMAAGLFDPQLMGLGDDQTDGPVINPHVFTCSSY